MCGLYALIRGQDAVKRRKAVALVTGGTSVVSTQVVNEVCVNLIRKAGFDDVRIERLVRAFYRRCVVVTVEQTALIEACRLRAILTPPAPVVLAFALLVRESYAFSATAFFTSIFR